MKMLIQYNGLAARQRTMPICSSVARANKSVVSKALSIFLALFFISHLQSYAQIKDKAPKQSTKSTITSVENKTGNVRLEENQSIVKPPFRADQFTLMPYSYKPMDKAESIPNFLSLDYLKHPVRPPYVEPSMKQKASKTYITHAEQ